MAREICVKPCVPLPLPEIHLPFMSGGMMAQADLTVQGGCAGCEILSKLMIQIQPFLGGLGPIICILGCVGSVIKVAQAIPDTIGPPPDPTKLLSALANIVIKCKCIIELALPFPVGAICEFVKMIADIVHLILSVLECIVGILQHLISLSLKATFLQTDEDVEVQKMGFCLAGQVQGLTDSIVVKMGALQALFEAIQPIFDLLSLVPGLGSVISGINTAFAIFTGGITVGVTPPSDVLNALNTLQDAFSTIDSTMQGIASICP